MTKDQVISLYNTHKTNNGKSPTRDQLCAGSNLRRTINKLFGNYSELQRVCGDRPKKFTSSIVTCNGCGSQFVSKHDGNVFCSKSCANKVVKLKHGKYSNFTPLTKSCEECGDVFTNSSKKFCSTKCRMINSFKDTPMKSIIVRDSQNRYDSIRSRARNFSKFFNAPCCERCGYDKHFEVCHIKPISSFDVESSLYDVNHPTNLIHLCPNCHWELDNGHLTIEDIRPTK